MGKKPAPRSPGPARRWALGSGSQTLSFAQRKEMIGKESQTKKGKEKEKEKKKTQHKKKTHQTPKPTTETPNSPQPRKDLGGQRGARDGKRGIRAASSGEIDWVQVCCFAELLKASLIFRR